MQCLRNAGQQPAVQNPRRQPHHRATGGIHITFQGGEIGQAIRGGIERAGGDQRFQIRQGDIFFRKQGHQSSRHVVVAGIAL